MRLFAILALVFISYVNVSAQQKEIQLKTKYGSNNKEVHDLLRFQDIEVIDLKFTGEELKGKNYRLLVKEFTNGILAKTDTIISSKADSYLTPIDSTVFQFKFYVKTELNNVVKMESQFNRFSTTKRYDIKASKDNYALHDFVKSNSLKIESNKPIYIMGYFLPYLDKKTGWKKYCDVAGSKYDPEDWGKVFNIPSYFLMEILFD
ncbi:hypothetical protein [uncultured Lacinutrix sp.]|uniref:hypothetical protein n=1 Tax=uncultured Lacinutrix sp. TaxID=574032 RepID=UPI00261B9DD9|nr:hypothetical protein [uncultured Lacinutrix sp.]